MNQPSPSTAPVVPHRSRARRVLQWSGISLGSLVVLVVLAVIIIPHVVNLAPVKHEIERVASRHTGRTITIDGPLSLSLFPWVGFGAQNVTMSNAPGFGEKPFMHVAQAEIHAELFPLIFGHVKVTGITLEHMTLNLERNTRGIGNWQYLNSAGKTQPQSGSSSSGTTNLANLSVGRIAFKDMTLNYDDARTDKRYTLNVVDLSADDIASGRPFPLQFHVVFNSRQPHVNAVISLNTRVQYDAALSHIALDKGSLSTRISGAGLPNALNIETQWRRISFAPKAGTAEIEGLQTTLAGATFHLDASANRLHAQPMIAGRLKTDSFSPRKLLAALGNPIPTRLQGFDKASFDTSLRYGGKAISLDHMRLKLDDSTITGKLIVLDIAQRDVRFDLALDAIDLNHYLPAGSGPARHAATAHSEKFLETRLPGRLLSKLDMKGLLTIGQLSGFGLKANALALKINAANGLVTLDLLTKSLYGGSYVGSIKLARAGQGVSLTTSQKLNQVDAGKIITALGGGSRLSGTANALIRLHGQGNTVGELLYTLKGNLRFDVLHGALEGVNLWNSLERAYVLVKEHRRMPASGPRRTQFLDFKGAAKIANGILINDALEATLPFLTLTGHGRVNLVKQYVDYDLLANVTKIPVKAPGGLSGLKGLTVPLHISGSFAELSSIPDIKQALEARARATVQKKFNKEKHAAKDELKKKLKELLGGGGGG